MYSSLPLHGPARAEALAMQHGERLALADAGGAPRLDANAIGYIGELNSGATAVSLPILNEAGIAMISPSNAAPGLTRRGPGTQPGEPDKYYPASTRTYFRLSPNDQIEGAALGAELARAGCRRLALADDRQVYATGILGSARRAAHGVRIVARRHIRPHRRYGELARALRRARADCVLGDTNVRTVGLYRIRKGALAWVGPISG